MGWSNNISDKFKQYFGKKDSRISGSSKSPISGTFGVDGSGGVSESNYSLIRPMLEVEADLHARYRDYEAMDDFSYIQTALDVYANDISQPDYNRGICMWVVTEDDWTKAELIGLLHGALEIEADIWPLARTLAHMGNSYGEILIDETGVIGINYLPPASMRRIMDVSGTTLGYIQDTNMRFEFNDTDMEYFVNTNASRDKAITATGAILYKPWEIVHWRLRAKHIRSVYGISAVEAARTVWKRLAMMEDASLMYRLERSPERLAFFIDVGSMPESEARQYINRLKQQYSKKKFYNVEKGGLDMRATPLSMNENLWIPTRDGKDSARIETIGGLGWTGTEDIDRFREALQGALKVPAAYLGFGADIPEKHLSHADVNFARSVMNIQREIMTGFKQVCRAHLLAIDKDPDESEWTLAMTKPTMIYELSQIEALAAKAQTIQSLLESTSLTWCLKNVMQFTDDEIVEIRKQRRNEIIDEGKTQAKAQSFGMEQQAEIEDEYNQDSGGDYGEESITFRKPVKPTKRNAGQLTERNVSKLLDARIKRAEGELTERMDVVGRDVRKSRAMMMELRSEMQKKQY